MPITSITTDFVGEVNVHPRLVRIICTDTYATVTTSNYLLSAINEGYVFYPSDYFFVMYGASSNSPALLTATIGTGPTSIILGAFSPSNGVTYTGSTTAGHFAKFNNTTGQIADTGMTPSDATKTKLAAVNGATVVGEFAKFSDINGTVQTTGITPSDATKAKVASVNGATVTNNVATFSDVAGTVQSSGTLLSALQLSSNILANNLAPWGGGATSHDYTITGITTSSVVDAWLVSQTNAANIVSRKVNSPNTLTVQFSVDPGANTVVGYIAFITPQ